MINKFDEGYFFLSNFYEEHFYVDNKLYRTMEHYFQSQKTLDIIQQEEIRNCETPGETKRLGRKVTLRKDWDKIKIDVMRKGLQLKFQNLNLRNKLIATNDKILIEGNNWHDNFWGNCDCEKCQRIFGKNNLGILLMQLRDNLK